MATAPPNSTNAPNSPPGYPGGSSTGPTSPMPSVPAPQLPQARPLLSGPVYFDMRKSKKKSRRRRKKYTRGTKGWQRLALGMARAGYRTANSVASGLNLFQRRSNRSMRRKRNGISELGRAPFQIARQIGTRRPRKLIRQFVPAGAVPAPFNQFVPGLRRR
jgi:hypothetical protein